jgi:hypothetical protein
VGFGDTIIDIPAGSQYYQTTVPMTYNSESFDVDIEVGLDPATGDVYARFQSIDPSTDLPPDVLTGFLPPEDGTGRGEGFISFIVDPKPNLPTGTQIHNVASITFDLGQTIATDQVNDEDPSQGVDPSKQALNTIDAGPPTSTVNPLPAVTTSSSVPVSWSGTDDPGGSGIASYTIYVSTDGGPFTPWLEGATLTQSDYQVQSGNTYAFYSVATDNVGNVQATPTAAQVTTTIAASAVATTTTVNSSENAARAGDAVTFTATVAAAPGSGGTPTGTVQFQIDGVDSGSPIALVDGSASYTPPPLSAGNHTVAAVFTSADGSFTASTGTLAGGQSVTAPPVAVATTTTLTASASTSVFGQSLTFTAVVAAQTAGSPTPAGIVSFLDGSAVVGSATLVDGVAQFTTTSFGLGSHAIRAVFAGGGTFTGSQSGTAGLSVQPDASTIVLTPTANPSPPKAALTLTATVGAASPGSGTPTGMVTFYNGKKVLGVASLSGGVATLTTKKLPLGSHSIMVIYHGDSDFTGTTSGTLREVIKKTAKGKKAKSKARVSTRAHQEVADRNPRAASNLVRSAQLRDLALEAVVEDWAISTSGYASGREGSRLIRSASPLPAPLS